MLRQCCHVKSFITLRYSQRRRPLISQDIQTNGTVGVDGGVVDLGSKTNLGRLERVIGGAGDGEEEDAPCVRRFTLIHRARHIESY